MRTIGGTAYPKETDLVNFPDSTVLNETITNEGTPVVREILGDPLTNLYALVRKAGLTPNQLEDNEENGYQILEALQKLPNVYNDLERILSIDGGSFKLDLPFGLLPNKYVCFAKSGENYNPAITTIIGSDNDPITYALTTNGFNSGDTVMIVLRAQDNAATIINVSAATGAAIAELFTVFGTPIGFSDTPEKIWYLSQNGKVFSDLPETYDFQTLIQEKFSLPFGILYEVILYQRNFICSVYDQTDNVYSFYRFSIDDLTDPIKMEADGFDVSDNGGTNVYNMMMFATPAGIFLTNRADCSPNQHELVKCTPDFDTDKLVYTGSVNISPEYVKTTNTVFGPDACFSLVNGLLTKFTYDGNPATILGDFDALNGFIFSLKGVFYYTNGEVAKRWILQ